MIENRLKKEYTPFVCFVAHGFVRSLPSVTNPRFELLSLPFSLSFCLRYACVSGTLSHIPKKLNKNRWPHHADSRSARHGHGVSGAADVADATAPFPVISSGPSGAADCRRASAEPWPADCVPLKSQETGEAREPSKGCVWWQQQTTPLNGWTPASAGSSAIFSIASKWQFFFYIMFCIILITSSG